MLHHNARVSFSLQQREGKGGEMPRVIAVISYIRIFAGTRPWIRVSYIYIYI